ncbi:hypothetical protein ASG90_02040 [Nocardioides sp. Soil797]|nr:hypothetical protein ASG90_02040 [Nocardioides sp. Soil797]
MITLAERLFAEQGTDAVSMRQVAIGAGQRNNSAVTYHFGSRAGLVQAILDHRSGPIDGRRCELIDELEASARPVAVNAVVRIFVQPLVEALDGQPGWYLRFLADVTVDPETGDAQQPHQPPGVAWINRNLGALLSDLPRDVRRRRMRWMVLIALRVLADHERIAAAPGASRPTATAITPDLVDTIAALLTAPATDDA